MSLNSVWIPTAADGGVGAAPHPDPDRRRPGPATAALASLLAQLDLISATGVITASPADTRAAAPAGEHLVEASGPIRFRFTPFPSPDPGRHNGSTAHPPG